jgi:DNA-directed RNA polymerase specialized sigma24 family protein
MDLYVERQCVDKMKEGEMKQFLALFDANFEGLYKYIARRVGDGSEIERVVRSTFLDALAKIQDTPTDASYAVWLYSLAKERVWKAIDTASFPEKQGLISSGDKTKSESDDMAGKVSKMMMKLSLEEREVLRLKFFEEVADGDVMTVIGGEEKTVGSKIYRVLKRAHLLLFGESDERQGVYFGELSGLLERAREAEDINIPEALKLSLRADLAAKIERKDFAIKGEVKEVKAAPFAKEVSEKPQGSNDPAKIFVEAAKGMNEEEREETYKEYSDAGDREQLLEILDKWKYILALIPAILFVVIIGVVLFNFMNGGGVERGYPTTCTVDVAYEGEFYDGLHRSVDRNINNPLCDYYEEEAVAVERMEDEAIEVDLDVEGALLEYRFVKKADEWRIKEYEKTLNSDKKSGKVLRNI